MQQNRLPKLILFICLTLVGLNIFVLLQFFPKPKTQELQFYALDVGQGDAFYLRTKEGQDILIDGGPDKSVVQGLGRAMPYGDKRIEMMMLTHPNSDHFEGLNYVLERYDVERVILSGYTQDSKGYKDFLENTAKEGSEMITVKKGDKLNFGADYMEILSPEAGQDFKDLNDTSVVGIFVSKEVEILFTGDSDLKDVTGLRDIDVLKVPHHGSKNNISKEVLDIIKPEVAIISVGKNNSYGHPHKEVVEMLENAGAKIYRTYELGNSEVLSAVK